MFLEVCLGTSTHHSCPSGEGSAGSHLKILLDSPGFSCQYCDALGSRQPDGRASAESFSGVHGTRLHSVSLELL